MKVDKVMEGTGII